MWNQNGRPRPVSTSITADWNKILIITIQAAKHLPGIIKYGST